ncbi:MAG: alpha/beta hydrolase [Planctomycetes bacterium]|nr:alpha/beta hydrolase [Planctomycetota bacterium]
MKRTLLALSFVLLSSTLHADFKPEIKYAEVNDVKLAYYTRGEGKPLLMINGFVSTMSMWDPALIEKLAKNHQVILFDNRGAGMSTDTKENNTTIPQMADDAAGLIKALGFEKADAIGWSMGARIAQQLVIRHPDAVGKIVFAAPNPGGSHSVNADKDVETKLNDPSIPLLQKKDLCFPPAAGGDAAAQALLDRINTAVKAGTMPDDFKTSKQTMERQNRARTTLWNADESNFAELKNIKNPVLVTGGREDIIDKPVNASIIANQIPFAWLAFFEGGHAFLFQSHDQFAATVNAFLE